MKLAAKPQHTLIAPAILVMLLLMIFPLLFSLRTSFYYYIITKSTYRPFIWFDNYKALFETRIFRESLVTTIQFSLGVLAAELIIAFVMAYALSKIPRYSTLFLSILIIPMMITGVAIGLTWRLLLHPDLGIVNYLLGLIGVEGKPWLAIKSTALPTLMFIETWRTWPFFMLIMYSTILSLPVEPFEAATIDGASELQKIRYLIFPFLRPVVVVAGTIRLIDLLRTYDLIYIATRGGPGSSTETVSYNIFKLAFTNLDLGQASAASYVVVIFIGIITSFLFMRLRGRTDLS